MKASKQLSISKHFRFKSTSLHYVVNYEEGREAFSCTDMRTDRDIITIKGNIVRY